MIKLILGYFTGLSPKTWLTIFAVLSLSGAVWWLRHDGYAQCESDVQAAQDSAKVAQLQAQIEELTKYQKTLLEKQSKNQKTIADLKKGIENAQDGTVAPALANAIDGLRASRDKMDK